MGHQEAVLETAEASSGVSNSHSGCWRRVVSAESRYYEPPLESQISAFLPPYYHPRVTWSGNVEEKESLCGKYEIIYV